MDIKLYGENLTKDELVLLVKRVFGEVLRKLRKEEKHLSQEKFSELTQLDTTYLSHLENGKKQASLTTILLLAAGLDISASQLIEKIEDQLKNKMNQ